MQKIIKKIEQEILFYFNLPINGMKAKTVLFFPEYPHKRTIVYKILKHLKFNITSYPGHKFDLGFYWQDETFRNQKQAFKKFNAEKLININCTDISKENISKAFEDVFNYGIIVNPLSYSGVCVKKNNLNARHDGIMVQCPVDHPEEGYVYQKLLNNIYNDDLVVDLRVPVLKGNIPFIYLKFKKIKDRFTNDLFKSEIASVEEHLTGEEVKNILRFCSRIDLDYGEMDVLRNMEDGKIYIVDVNYTPWGPPAELSEEEKRMAIVRMSEAFKKIFFK